MLPLIRFKDMLESYKAQMEEDFEELINAAHLVASRPNYLTLDENGFFHVQSSGKIDEVIVSLKEHLARLERIKTQKHA